MAGVAFRGVTKRFDGRPAVDHLDLEVADGELLVLLGPSGCGKTTALRMVAGLEQPDEGAVVLDGRVVNDVEPKDRDVAMVFQSYALYPHLSVERNIEFPLRQRGISAEDRRRRVREVAESLGLGDLLDRKPRQLSGGQRQRVALARAIVRQPQAFLMDEPLSNLDAALRLQTRADIVALQARLGTTTLYVTHDQVEAMTMGHRIAVMDRGVLQQLDAPPDLYERPANTFVARFLGSPGMNLLPAALDHLDARSAHLSGGGGYVLLGAAAASVAGQAGSLVVGVRPEHLSLSATGTLDATVLLVELLGADVHVLCTLADGTRLVVRQEASAPRPAMADHVRIAATPGSVHVFTGDSGLRLGGPG
ncbi:MAG TPA: ABC transporter ATP-binding protein [Acidimicrobiales bacterium]|nr:ABC transporter ATP-binding protein [Acidimicrobiales bacterium]